MIRNESQQLTLLTAQFNLNNRTFHKRATINEGKSKEEFYFKLTIFLNFVSNPGNKSGSSGLLS